MSEQERESERERDSENNYFTETCSGSKAGSYLRLIDFVHHSTLGLREIKTKKKSSRLEESLVAVTRAI